MGFCEHARSAGSGASNVPVASCACSRQKGDDMPIYTYTLSDRPHGRTRRRQRRRGRQRRRRWRWRRRRWQQRWRARSAVTLQHAAPKGGE
eukprot:192685-Prymnesium_polylepis.1